MFMIVTRDDFPVFELPIDQLLRTPVAREKKDLCQFILNASLDAADQTQWTSN